MAHQAYPVLHQQKRPEGRSQQELLIKRHSRSRSCSSARDDSCEERMENKRKTETPKDRKLNNSSTMPGRVSAATQQQVRDALAGLGMNKVRDEYIDDFMKKIKYDLIDSAHRDDETSLSDAPLARDSDSLSSCSISQPFSKPEPNTKQRRHHNYQATVESDVEDSISLSNPSPLDEDAPELLITGRSTTATTPMMSPSISTTSGSSKSIFATAAVSRGTSPHSQGRADQQPPQRPPIKGHRPSVHFSTRPPPVVVHTSTSRSEPTTPIAAPPQHVTLSAVDKKWGHLFDDRGMPTARLHSILRGLAKYLVTSFHPNERGMNTSMVVTPELMHHFYSKFKVESEKLEFHRLFEYRSSRGLYGLSMLYQVLGCEFYLVSSEPGAWPDTPALTPKGFASWMTILIQGFPDREAKRLDSIFADLPVETEPLVSDMASKRDIKPERLPKQLSRHLLPAVRNEATYTFLAKAVSAWNRDLHLAADTSSLPRTQISSSSSSGRNGNDGTYHSSSRTAEDRRGRGYYEKGGEVEVSRRRREGQSYTSSKPYNRSGSSRDESGRGDAGSSTSTSTSKRYLRTLSRHRFSGERDISPSRRRQSSPPPSPNRRYSNTGGSSQGKGSSTAAIATAHMSGGGHSSVGGGGSCRTSTGTIDVESRRTREDEYRLAQGRDRWGSMDSTPRGLPERPSYLSRSASSTAGSVGFGGGGSSKRRSTVVTQDDEYPTFI